MAEFISDSTVTYTETLEDYVETFESNLSSAITSNMTEKPNVEVAVATGLLSIGLGIIIIGTIFGNALTLTAISKHRPLQTPPNYLIASLAVADLMVAILVMPLSLTKEVVVIWMFGPILCDAWISLDVLFCTASILSLCMISVDRFLAITKPVRYPKYRTVRTMLIFIAVVWFLSSIISTSPLFGWRSNQNIDAKTCQISQNRLYTIFSTFGAFFIPMSIMMILYARIFCEARKRIRGKQFSSGQPFPSNVNYREATSCVIDISDERKTCSNVTSDSALETQKGEGSNGSTLCQKTHTMSAPNLQNEKSNNEEVKKTTYVTSLTVPGQQQTTRTSLSLREINANESPSSQRSLLPSPSPLPNQLLERERKRRAIASAREHRATKTLGIVTGAFLACWLPFFLHALIVPLCGEACYVPKTWQSIFLWLGYFNSMLNPIIYTKFNRDFQKAFKKLLHCKDSKTQSP